MNRIYTIKSLSNYVDLVAALQPHNCEDCLFKDEIVFRGLSNSSYQLSPSLGRCPSQEWLNTLTMVEDDLVSRAIQKFPDLFANDDLPIAKLAKLQHFGIPTRLMDVTSNALVALFFACQHFNESECCDGEVVAFSSYSLSAINPYVNIVADTYRLTANAYTSIETYYYRAIQQYYSIILQNRNWEKPSKASIHRFIQKFNRPLLVDGFDAIARQKNQHGKYYLFPNKIIQAEPDGNSYISDGLVEMDKDDEMIIKRLIIPKEMKKEIVDKLRLFGISKEFLFADSIETVLESVKQKQVNRFK